MKQAKANLTHFPLCLPNPKAQHNPSFRTCAQTLYVPRNAASLRCLRKPAIAGTLPFLAGCACPPLLQNQTPSRPLASTRTNSYTGRQQRQQSKGWRARGVLVLLALTNPGKQIIYLDQILRSRDAIARRGQALPKATNSSARRPWD